MFCMRSRTPRRYSRGSTINHVQHCAAVLTTSLSDFPLKWGRGGGGGGMGGGGGREEEKSDGGGGGCELCV